MPPGHCAIVLWAGVDVRVGAQAGKGHPHVQAAKRMNANAGGSTDGDGVRSGMCAAGEGTEVEYLLLLGLQGGTTAHPPGFQATLPGHAQVCKDPTHLLRPVGMRRGGEAHTSNVRTGHLGPAVG